jgi:hypothetical protein
MVVLMQPFLVADDLSMVNLSDVSRSYSAGDNAMDWIKLISRDVVTPAYVLRRLAASSDSELRMAVADHLNTSQEVLLLLSQDTNPDVRYAIAENHNISKDVLQSLLDDENPYVVSRAEKTIARLNMNETARPQLRICASA